MLDKTGTITKGEPELTDLAAFNGFTEEEVLRLTAKVPRGVLSIPLEKPSLQVLGAGLELWRAEGLCRYPGARH